MEKYFNNLNNTFHGVIAAPLLAFIFLFLQLDKELYNAPFGDSDYRLLAFIVFLLYVAYTIVLFRKYRNRLGIIAQSGGSLSERLEEFRVYTTRFYVYMTLPALVVLLAMGLTGEKSFGVMYFLQLIILSVHRPSVHNISKGLKLKGEERDFVLKKKSFEDPDSDKD